MLERINERNCSVLGAGMNESGLSLSGDARVPQFLQPVVCSLDLSLFRWLKVRTISFAIMVSCLERSRVSKRAINPASDEI